MPVCNGFFLPTITTLLFCIWLALSLLVLLCILTLRWTTTLFILCPGPTNQFLFGLFTSFESKQQTHPQSPITKSRHSSSQAQVLLGNIRSDGKWFERLRFAETWKRKWMSQRLRSPRFHSPISQSVCEENWGCFSRLIFVSGRWETCLESFTISEGFAECLFIWV